MSGRKRRQPPCEMRWFPHGLRRARFYVVGYRCDRHSPAALAGQPEPQPGPGWPAGAWTTPTPDAFAHVIDDRAIASGKRRSSPEEYRAAQAAVRKEKPR